MKAPLLGRGSSRTASTETPASAGADSQAAEASPATDQGRRLPPRAPVLPTPRRRARRGLLAAGVVLAVIFALGAYVLVQKSGERITAIGLAKDVSWGQVITQDDLTPVQVPQDSGLRTVAWGTASSVVGQRAAVDLVAGSLLTSSSIESATSVPAEGTALVGVKVAAGQAPTTPLVPGDRVAIVRFSQQSAASAGPTTGASAVDPNDLGANAVEAEVFAASTPASGGDRTVDVLVKLSDSSKVAAMSAAGEASIIVLPRQ